MHKDLTLNELLQQPGLITDLSSAILSPEDDFGRTRSMEELYVFLKHSKAAQIPAELESFLIETEFQGDASIATSLSLAQLHLNRSGNTSFDWRIWSRLMQASMQAGSPQSRAEISYFLVGRDIGDAFRLVADKTYEHDDTKEIDTCFGGKVILAGLDDIRTSIERGIRYFDQRFSKPLLASLPHAYGKKRYLLAEYDEEGVYIYQAYNDDIADAALISGRFGFGFRTDRMTWLKLSLSWLVRRSRAAKAPNQTRVLRVKIPHDVFQSFLKSAGDTQIGNASDPPETVKVQWDPERDYFGDKTGVRAIQIGISRSNSELYKNSIRSIKDVTKQVQALSGGAPEIASRVEAEFLPRQYPLRDRELARDLKLAGED